MSALHTDLDWLREHTRLLQRASEWDSAGRTEFWLLFGDSIVEAKAWAARRPEVAPEPTALHYPWQDHPVDHIMATTSLSDDDKLAILGGNAAKVFGMKV